MDRLKDCFVVFLCVFIQFSANESVAQETDQEDRHVGMYDIYAKMDCL